MQRHRPNDRLALTALAIALANIAFVFLLSWSVQTQQVAHQPPSSEIKAEYPKYEPNEYGPAEGYWWPQIAARDTYAQWLMALFSIVATIASIWAVLYIKWTFDETRESNERQQRAYISVKRGGIWRLTDDTQVIGLADIVNEGETPALDVDIYVLLTRTPRQTETVEAFRFDLLARRTSDLAIQPRAEMTQGSDPNEATTEGLNDAKGFLFVYGVVHYTDVFGAKHFTRFCHRYALAVLGQTADIGSKRPEGNIVINASVGRFNKFGNSVDREQRDGCCN